MSLPTRLILGVTRLDEDHARLARVLADVVAAHAADASPSLLRGLLERLLEETAAHFSREEALMDALDYPDALAHRRRHGDLLTVGMLLLRCADGRRGDLLQVLDDWLFGHIDTADRMLARFAVTRGV